MKNVDKICGQKNKQICEQNDILINMFVFISLLKKGSKKGKQQR
jgi:hypothetical protein